MATTSEPTPLSRRRPVHSAAGTVLLATLALPLPLAADPAAVAFDWFTYTGHDAALDATLPAGQFRNPILAGFYPDPSICRVGDDYYLVNSTFSYFPGIPIFHSRDLVNWTQLGHVIDRPTQLDYAGLGVSRGLFAPALSHHDGTFYLVCTMVGGGGNFLVTTRDPAGPWSDPVGLGFEGIDPSLFFDDDGRAWMLNNGNPPDNQPLYEGHRAIWMQEFDLASAKLVGPRRVVVNGGTDLARQPVWIEGPHLYKKDGWYYLSAAEGGTSTAHSQVVFRSRAVTGPFAPWSGNPILTQRDLDPGAPGAVCCTGHADLTLGPDGHWWAVFLGARPFDGRHWTTGRETFLLPVTWTDDGWPRILPAGARVPLVAAAPKTAPAARAAAAPPLPLTGNFTWRDDFAAPTLGAAWVALRAPAEGARRLADHHLWLQPRADRLAGSGRPAFVARRVQHAAFTATTRVATPARPGVSAGLALFQSEHHHYYYSVARTVSGVRLVVERWNGPGAEVVATRELPAVAELELRLVADRSELRFAYALRPGEWEGLGPVADALAVTVQAAGDGLHFTGAVVGLHAREE